MSIRLIDLRLGGVLDETDLNALMAACDDYREATTQLLLQSLWHSWHSRLRMRSRIRALRTQVEALHQRQQAAMTLLTSPEHTRAIEQILAVGPGEA
ncbi:hypothetical protein [Actinomadura macrotermitis]|uniref:Uncharacterized protein n=1 Tax=Actinomadura macrotermitis TaxID=2585200 RepID=A0A7K0BTZ6_9ACTN|nr:hypothetical protein [Actinomadura macrotermitis]MQY04607.1 hypothetical protein [Actinomadura macrotermitis]